MARTKKALSLILSVVMVLSIFAINAFAAGEEATFTVTSSATTIAKDDVITITVSASSASATDFYAGPMCIPVTYNSTMFSFVADSVVVSDVFGATYTKSSVNTTTAGLVQIAIVPTTSGSPVAPELDSTGITLFTFQLKVLGTEGNGITIGIKDDQKTTNNSTGTFYCGTFSTSDPKTATLTEIGQTLNRVDATVGFAGAATPELVAKTGTTGVVDSTNMYVYGVTAGDSVLDYFEATNSGTLAQVTNGSSVNGTGATLQLKQGDTVLATYTVIIFGDINGDANITAADVSATKAITQNATVADYAKVAADVSGAADITNPVVTAADLSTIKGYTQNVTAVVNPYA